ncbi:MAG: PKD domain-containing protein [Bacteroidales bacterium]|nr:PKD domain-containing protein [Bacteroidales bacterium]
MTRYLHLLFIFVVCGLGAQAQSQKIKVLEYMPAPGQFINTLPEADGTTSQDDMNASCADALNSGLMVCLGPYGGYITVAFDHPVQNGVGSDLRICGNGYYANSDPVYGRETIGGSFEPGIVMVGVGDNVDTAKWYELAGWEYYTGEVHDFEITYYKPTAESGTATEPFSTYDEYIRWEATWTQDGERCDSTGYHMKNSFHQQSYWPEWVTAESLTFKGGRLPNNAVNYGTGNSQYWVMYRYAPDAYGYVDDSLNTDIYSTFDISWAVDEDGNPVELNEINFIRVYTGIFQYCGWLGESSTEITEFIDLHLIPGYDEDPIIITPREVGGVSSVIADPRSTDDSIYDLMGRKVVNPSHGIYIKSGKKIYVK